MPQSGRRPQQKSGTHGTYGSRPQQKSDNWNMRWAVAYFGLLLTLGPIIRAQSGGEADKLAPGRFLVASRDLGDPNFAQSVILLVQYSDEQGAMGLIINRRTEVPLSRVLQELKEAKSRTDPVYVGGPVELESVLALLRSSSKPGDAKSVFGDVYLMSSKELLQKTLASSVDANAFHVYLGYAGWSHGQLEHEVELGAWHIMPAISDEVFHSDPESVWPRLIRRTETQIAAAPIRSRQAAR
jgi:putative transcriptional regulator